MSVRVAKRIISNMEEIFSTNLHDTCVYYTQLYIGADNYGRLVYPVCKDRFRCTLKKIMDLYYERVLQRLSK